MIEIILNSPYSLVGIVLSLISGPIKISATKNPPALIMTVHKFWWAFGYMKNARAMAIGNIVILGPNILDKDLEHELIHVEQQQRRPFIQPLLYTIELYRKGYRENKYEKEAYDRAGNIYKGKA